MIPCKRHKRYINIKPIAGEIPLDDVIKWKHFPRYWPFVRGIHKWSVDSPHKGQWRGALRVYLICAWTNGLANNQNASDLRRHRAQYDVNVMNKVCTNLAQGQPPHLQWRWSSHCNDHFGVISNKHAEWLLIMILFQSLRHHLSIIINTILNVFLTKCGSENENSCRPMCWINWHNWRLNWRIHLCDDRKDLCRRLGTMLWIHLAIRNSLCVKFNIDVMNWL